MYTPYGPIWEANASAEPATVTVRLLMDGIEAARATLLLTAWDNGHVILTYTPDLTGVIFDITDAAAASERRVLLSNTKDSQNAPLAPYPFFQGLLARDRVVPIGLRTYVDGIATSGVAVTLRILDPPDLSPYIIGATGGNRQLAPHSRTTATTSEPSSRLSVEPASLQTAMVPIRRPPARRDTSRPS
ncbi:MAG TPA: hypothetical protein VHW00_09495 [Thermoanaerobaculia bacterium]|nr:hypothetical protein [Thermoanaerobaculia bacterium]